MEKIEAESLNAGSFTPREAEVARLIAEGWSNKDIARILAIALKTVDAHTGVIYQKLGVRSRSINTRCTAIVTMVARGMVSLSIKSLVMVLALHAAQLDDQALRVKSVRLRVPMLRVRGRTDA